MKIRRNDPRDLRPFAELNIAWIRELHSVEPSDMTMYESPELYTENGNSLFAAIIDGETAGVCALKQDAKGAWELTKMAVDPAYQRRGIAEALLRHIEAYARDEMGLKSIYLLSSTKNDTAIRLYQKMGWTVIHEGPHPKYSRCNIGMEKVL